MHRFIDQTFTAERALAAVLIAASMASQAALPTPTPAQATATAEKKQQADAQAKLDQQALLARMDDIATRWRASAREHGWAVHPPVPIAAPAEALKAPADMKAAPAATPASAKPPSAAPAPKGQP